MLTLLNRDATALEKGVAAVFSGLKNERKVAKEEGFTRSAFQKHVELYRFVPALLCVMLVCTANVTHEANACENLCIVVALVLALICYFRFLRNITMLSSGALMVSKPQAEFNGPPDYLVTPKWLPYQ